MVRSTWSPFTISNTRFNLIEYKPLFKFRMKQSKNSHSPHNNYSIIYEFFEFKLPSEYLVRIKKKKKLPPDQSNLAVKMHPQRN